MHDDDVPARPPLVTVLRITWAGAAEVLLMEPSRDDVGLLVGRDPADVTARVTATITGGLVTFWTAASAENAGWAVNVPANRAATALFPPITIGGREFPCRQRARLEEHPLRGDVLVTGYDPATRAICGLMDVALEQLRRLLDGRAERARRQAASLAAFPVARQPSVVSGTGSLHVFDDEDAARLAGMLARSTGDRRRTRP
jgi:hypothetical protein